MHNNVHPVGNIASLAPTPWKSLMQTKTTSIASSRGCCQRKLGTSSRHDPERVSKSHLTSAMSSKRPKFFQKLEVALVSRTSPRSRSPAEASSIEQPPLADRSATTGQEANDTTASIPTLESSLATETTSATSPRTRQTPSNGTLATSSTLNHPHLSTSQDGGRRADEEPEHVLEKDQSLAETAKPRDLWEEAYERLARDKSGLIAQYEKILALEEREEEKSSRTAQNVHDQSLQPRITHSTTRLTALAKKKLASLDESRLTIKLGSRTLKFKDGVDPVVKVLIAAKDFVSGAVASEPHAALAWTGVCMLLPLLLNPKTQYDDASTGLLEIPLIIHRYQVLDAVYRSSEEVDGQLKTAFEEKLADLYCNILEFQVRAVCQWSRHALHQYGRDIFKADGWAKLFKDIKDLDSACKDIAQTMDAGLFRIVLDKQSQHLQELISSWYSQQQKTLEKLLDQMQQLNVNAEAQRREQQSREEQDQEIKCHQAFGPSTYVSHKNRNPLRVPGTCKWFLDHPQFLKWKQDELSSLLWVSADPGCGKSVLARTLIDEGLLSDDLLTPSVCYFFFKDGSPEQQGAAKSISAILHQLFNDQPHLIRHALEDYRREGQNISSSFEKTWSILTIAAADPAARKIVCVLDALDECEEDSRKLIIDSLKTLYSDTEHTQSLIVKFLVTSRPYEDIQRHFRSLTKDFPTIRLKGEQESEAISQEINLVIRERLVPEISVELDLSSAVEASLFDMLLKVPNRTYLWLHLISDEMRQTSGSTSAKGLGQLVSRIPKSVDEAYDKILNRARDFALCRRLLHLVLAARRSLSVAEMNVAFHIKEGMRSTADLDLETDARFQERIRNLCGLFITIVNNEIFLIHQTAREYLVQPETCTCHKSVWKHSFSSEESERLLAKCCIFYLRFAEFEMDNPFWIDGNATSRAFFWSRNGYKRREVRRRYKATLESAVHKAVGISDLCISIVPFFGYSSHFWLEHFLNKETSDEVALASAIDLCDPRSRSFTQWMIIHFDSVHSYLLHQSDTPLGESIEGLLTFSSLMVAVRLGWHWLVCKLLEDDTKDVNYSDIHGDTALTLAAALGNATVVKMLVAAGAKVNAVTFGNKSALHKAIKSGDKETTRILIESDANLNCIGGYPAEGLYGTPLQNACFYGNIAAVRLLLDHGAHANLDGRDFYDDPDVQRAYFLPDSGPPLFLAAKKSNLEIAQLLLDHGADITVNGTGAALHVAAIRRDVEMLKLLLDRGADPEQPYSDGTGNPYVWCLKQGHRHYVFDDIFHRSSRETGVTSARRAVLVAFLLQYRPESFPSMPELALTAAAMGGRLDDMQLVFDNCELGPEVLVRIARSLERIVMSLERSRQDVQVENAEDAVEEVDKIWDENPGEVVAYKDGDSHEDEHAHEDKFAYDDDDISGIFNPRFINRARWLRKKLLL